MGWVLCGHSSLIEHLRLGGVWQLRLVSKFKHITKHVFGIQQSLHLHVLQLGGCM